MAGGCSRRVARPHVNPVAGSVPMFGSAAGGISLPGLAISALAEPMAGRRPIPGLRFPFPSVGRLGGRFRSPGRIPLGFRKNTVGFIEKTGRKQPEIYQWPGKSWPRGANCHVRSLTVALGLIKRRDKKGW